ncbi:MAG: 4Fe-4S ferredoxin, iron-sulfur binding domain protein [Acidobacteria bacterium]|nr:4Fe-4S ferredoxin, iron-sulfur binding domain protein [Acidobacteriota bacterium]
MRRRGDRSQVVRRSVQAGFLLLNLWIGARFYLFVRYYESGGGTVFASRPPGVEGYLPIAGLMNLKYFLGTGTIPAVHPAALVLLLAFLGMAFAFRKAFCSWLCPVGTVSEWLWQGGREIFGRTWVMPRWLDLPLRGLKYLVLGLFLWAVLGMSAQAIQAFMESPYGIIADVKMLNFFRHLGQTGAVVLLALAAWSVLVKNPWCRYLCPYGALLGLVSLPSPAAIRRSPEACIDCAKCAKACPSLLPVDQLIAVRSAECTGCLECVAACPAAGALDLSAAGRRLTARAVAWGLAAILTGMVGAAIVTGHWHSQVPEHLYFDLVPRANSFAHPR